MAKTKKSKSFREESPLKVITKSNLKKNGILIVAVMLIIVGLSLLSNTLNEMQYQKETLISEKQILESQLSIKQANVSSLQATINSSEIDLSKDILLQEDFLKFVSGNSTDYKLKVNKLTGGEVFTENGVIKINYKIELQGAKAGLKSFIYQLEKKTDAYTINSLSYRRNEGYTWLTRDVDGENVLSWINAGELSGEEEKDTGKNTAKPVPPQNSNGNLPVKEKNTVAKMMIEGEYKLFIDLDFLKIV